MKTFEVSSEPIPIAAPAAFVWEILTAVEKYRVWNPFTPEARTYFSIGSPAHLRVRMGPATFRITETVCAFEQPRLIAWRKEFGARRFLTAVREQHLQPVSETSCTYWNSDILSGFVAYPVFLLFGGYMRRGFTNVGEGLKRYAEAAYVKAQAGAA